MQHTSLSSIIARILDTAAVRENLQDALTLVDSIDVVAAAPTSKQDCISEQQVRAIIRAREARSAHFPADLFADPAWDILLDLFAAKLGQRKVCVSSACLSAGVPTTTALRCLGFLEQKGLVVRSADLLDGRRVFVELSSCGTASMHSYFNSSERETAH